MRRPVVAGNWKMNLSRLEANQLLKNIRRAGETCADVDFIVFPSFVFLPMAETLLSGSKIAWGAQNMHDEPFGPFTGEVSAPMLSDFGCCYVLVGHSERRGIFHEDNQWITKKVSSALSSGLSPILCVGETQDQREAGETIEVIKGQLSGVLSHPTVRLNLDKLLIAYEPVWAIGTGLSAMPEEVQAVHEAIRCYVADIDKELAQTLRILYGGSVKPDNVLALSCMTDVDGALIGGASLKIDSFIGIAKQWNKSF